MSDKQKQAGHECFASVDECVGCANLRIGREQGNAERQLFLEIMRAAAAEIEEHWDAHCDSQGFGPTNLVRRLKKGYHGGGYGDQPILRAHEPPFSAFNNHGHDCAGISDRNGHGVSLELVAELLNQMREEWAATHGILDPSTQTGSSQ